MRCVKPRPPKCVKLTLNKPLLLNEENILIKIIAIQECISSTTTALEIEEK